MVLALESQCKGSNAPFFRHEVRPLVGVSALSWVSFISTVCWATGRAGKGKGFPCSLPSVGPRADPGVQAVSPQVTVSHPPGGRLPLLSSRPAVTFPAAEHHSPRPVPSYTAWWQRHIGVNNLPKVVTQLLPRV